jgi:hypothetical protein
LRDVWYGWQHNIKTDAERNNKETKKKITLGRKKEVK